MVTKRVNARYKKKQSSACLKSVQNSVQNQYFYNFPVISFYSGGRKRRNASSKDVRALALCVFVLILNKQIKEQHAAIYNMSAYFRLVVYIVQFIKKIFYVHKSLFEIMIDCFHHVLLSSDSRKIKPLSQTSLESRIWARRE